MKTHLLTLCARTSGPSLYYVDGKRVTRDRFDDFRDYGRACCFLTTRTKYGYRHTHTVTK